MEQGLALTTSTSAAGDDSDPEAGDTDATSEENAEASSDDQSWRRKSMVLLLLDGCARTGGFAFFCYLLFGLLAGSCNRQLYLKKVIEESFLVKRNEHFHGPGARSAGNNRAPSKAGDRKNKYATPSKRGSSGQNEGG